MTRTNWILLAGSLLILIFVLIRKSRHAAERQRRHRVSAIAYQWPDNAANYGYYIKIDNDTVVNQRYIPAINARIPFSSQSDAQKTGDWIARHLVQTPHQLPAISIKDLDSLGIQHP
ncbi:protein of unknown function [Chitinophaga costaii]|uniref:DUF4907 domain-containing protein n=1 Tax=Chitinophaga costaii TaxID=1335309 RepID=A0A1C3ZIW7_9BACT|nr:DUF4907 domain-containing protein [Chitinophaga costaii]PUZ30396.1 DUF4907 domain-containing protein [Chitinophaga costaii]SCB82359.1 protein of unknown function [Chitinophaga costaii]